MASKRKEAGEIQGGTFTDSTRAGARVLAGAAGYVGLGETKMAKSLESWGAQEHNAETLTQKIEEEDKTGAEKIALQKAAMDKAEEVMKATPTVANRNAFIAERDKWNVTKQEVADEVKKTRDELQDILVKLDPHSFAEMVPKQMLFNQEFMRNASRAQLMAVLGSDHFSEIEKDKVRAARYGHIQKARQKVKDANKGYEERRNHYVNFYKKAADPATTAADLDALIQKELDIQGKLPGTVERALKENDIKDAINAYRTAATPAAKQEALEKGLDELQRPTKKMIGDVDAAVRVWIRAMNEHELDEMYKYDPEMVGDRDVTPTIRSRAIIYARSSEKISSKDSDKFRDSKLCPIIDANDLKNGIGELAPTFATFQHMVDKMIANGGGQAEVVKRMAVYNDPAAYKKLEGGSEEALAEWEKIKEDYLRKAVKTIADEKGKEHVYKASFNEEQKAMATFGARNMTDAIGGQSNDEFALLRGVRWRDPAFVENIDRGMAREFRTKDTSDIKELMDMVMWNFKHVLANPMEKMSQANMDLLHWVATESAGKEFIKRNQINPELQDAFGKMERIFGHIGRNGKPTYVEFDAARAALGI